MADLVTGAAGFIGSHVAKRLLEAGRTVVGVDNLNDYYDPRLKASRLERLQSFERFTFIRADVSDREAMAAVFSAHRPARVVHLAAQAGVRYSIENPYAYIESNVTGFLNVLESCRVSPVEHLVYASTSSVYGLNAAQPFSERHNVDHPISLYSATKKANELMAHTYAHLFGIPSTGLRFFTVYGPWGRPDMALFKFTRGILAGEAIPVYNHGRMIRDFTYVDDVVEGIIRVLALPPSRNPQWDAASADPPTSSAPYRVCNIGNSDPVELIRYIRAIEAATGKQAILEMLPMQPGDVPSTMADVSVLEELTGFRPATTVEDGVQRFVDWYREYYQA